MEVISHPIDVTVSNLNKVDPAAPLSDGGDSTSTTAARAKMIYHCTQMCTYAEKNEVCPNPETCTYAHSTAELVANPYHKTKMCPDAQCAQGEKCRFAHTPDELRPLPKVAKTTTPEVKPQNPAPQQSQGAYILGRRYTPTQLRQIRNTGKVCRHYFSGATCPFLRVGDCPFVHLRGTDTAPLPAQVCSFFVKSKCLRTPCKYFHGPEDQLAQLREQGATVYHPARYMPLTTAEDEIPSADVAPEPPMKLKTVTRVSAQAQPQQLVFTASQEQKPQPQAVAPQVTYQALYNHQPSIWGPIQPPQQQQQQQQTAQYSIWGNVSQPQAQVQPVQRVPQVQYSSLMYQQALMQQQMVRWEHQGVTYVQPMGVQGGYPQQMAPAGSIVMVMLQQ